MAKEKFDSTAVQPPKLDTEHQNIENSQEGRGQGCFSFKRLIVGAGILALGIWGGTEYISHVPTISENPNNISAPGSLPSGNNGAKIVPTQYIPPCDTKRNSANSCETKVEENRLLALFGQINGSKVKNTSEMSVLLGDNSLSPELNNSKTYIPKAPELDDLVNDPLNDSSKGKVKREKLGGKDTIVFVHAFKHKTTNNYFYTKGVEKSGDVINPEVKATLDKEMKMLKLSIKISFQKIGIDVSEEELNTVVVPINSDNFYGFLTPHLGETLSLEIRNPGSKYSTAELGEFLGRAIEINFESFDMTGKLNGDAQIVNILVAKVPGYDKELVLPIDFTYIVDKDQFYYQKSFGLTWQMMLERYKNNTNSAKKGYLEFLNAVEKYLEGSTLKEADKIPYRQIISSLKLNAGK